MPRPSATAPERAALALMGQSIEIDGEGRVWRVARYGRPCVRYRAESAPGRDGYRRVGLEIPGVGFRPVLAHRLVYEACCGGIPLGHVVYPANGDRADTRPENLRTRPGKLSVAAP